MATAKRRGGSAMKEYAKVWEDKKGNIRIDIDEDAPVMRIAMAMVDELFGGNEEKVTSLAQLTAAVLALETTGKFESDYIGNVRKMVASVRKQFKKMDTQSAKNVVTLKVKPPKKAS